MKIKGIFKVLKWYEFYLIFEWRKEERISSGAVSWYLLLLEADVPFAESWATSLSFSSTNSTKDDGRSCEDGELVGWSWRSFDEGLQWRLCEVAKILVTVEDEDRLKEEELLEDEEEQEEERSLIII